MKAEQGLTARLAWVTALRLGFLTLLLGATASFYLGGELSRPFSLRIVLTIIGAAYGLAAVYAAILRSGKSLARLAEVQVVLDQVTWTGIVWVSGGATSGATSFYALSCLVGATLIGRRGAIIGAASGIPLYGLLCAGFHWGWISPPRDQPPSLYAIHTAELIYPLLQTSLGVLVVAVLAGYLAERLRITGGALDKATVRADEAERLAELGRIAAWLAHEIRNPLGSISGSIEMLREAPALSNEDKQLCDIVHREAARLNDLVGDMLDLSKPRSPDPTNIDVAALAREVSALASRSAHDGTGAVDIRYLGTAGAVMARCDGPQMRQVLWNLVRNAVQASPPGTTVTVEVTSASGTIDMLVSDSGPGLSEEAQARIFDAFYTTRSHGAGIGLAVVKRIIDDHAAMGAKITAVNREGSGAAFRVSLRAASSSGAPARNRTDS
jgi:two-component system sensor histidine kinase HydH